MGPPAQRSLLRHLAYVPTCSPNTVHGALLPTCLDPAGMLFHSLYAPDLGVDVMQRLIELEGIVDVELDRPLRPRGRRVGGGR